MRIVPVLLTLVLTASLALAQESVPPPPKPVNDAPANAEVLKLLRAGVSERAILHVISAAAGTFDTSADALAALKLAGASEAELSAIQAQGAAPANAPPAGAQTNSGPSLAETMQFIQDKLNDIGKVAYVTFRQDVSDGRTATYTRTSEISNVVADQNQCRISYDRKGTGGGKTYKDENSVFSLRDVQDIVVRPWEQLETEYQAKNGYPNVIVTSNNPPITVLEVRRPHGEENVFLFIDANLADRVAKAMSHAVELCGGGNKEKF
ncbi:MAG TPA: hypothetical protein VGE85_05595 [Terracidiphilus sp.]|jgi:hypothetical protein